MLFTVEEPKPFFTRERKFFFLKISILVFGLLTLVVWYIGKSVINPEPIITSSVSVGNIPTAPKIEKPLPVSLPFPQNICNQTSTTISASIDNARFSDCVVSILSGDITLSNAEFNKSILIVSEKATVTLRDVVFNGLKNGSSAVGQIKDENKSVLVASGCSKIQMLHVDFLNNEFPVRISGCEIVEIADSNFLENLMGGAVILTNNKKVKIRNNNFSENYPSALEITNLVESNGATLDIYKNTFSNNFGDQIHFRTFRNNQITRIFNNVILGGRAAQILIDGDSIGANIKILNNYLGKSVKCSDVSVTFPNDFTGWCYGRPNGIVIDSSSDINLSGNVIVQNENTGITINRSKNISIRDNLIARSGTYGINAKGSLNVQLFNNKLLENKEDLNSNATVTIITSAQK